MNDNRSASLTLRAESAADQAQVFATHCAAFGRPEEAHLVDALRRAATPQLSLVAEVAGAVVGHIFFSPAAIEPLTGDVQVACLAPVAVAPAHQGRGIGTALVRAGLAQCPALGWQAVFLVGAPAYYARFGFVLAAPLGLTYGDARFDTVLQVIELVPGALRHGCGRLRLHAAFAETGTG